MSSIDRSSQYVFLDAEIGQQAAYFDMDEAVIGSFPRKSLEVKFLALPVDKIYIVHIILQFMADHMTTQMVIRINPELKKRVNELAKSEGKNVSQVVRELLERYIQERDISGYINDLWVRVGDKMRANRISVEDIDQIIADVRREFHESKLKERIIS
ncbi:ribbon-helix-helix protein, CopG family [candidate division CSSED10-310 bacterium]|uniref:Ribbon-helix-helix protein, CopG family n=1 Tax=candidate division CSSED10-310 bacterium TaxID=2855610 RepID=A0ABV6YZN5_UNCC1